MSVFQPGKVAYGLSQPLIGVPNAPILSQRNPTTDDRATLGTIWINQVTNQPFIITSILDNVSTWVPISSGASILQIVTDAGTAMPVAGSINLFGGANIATSAAGNTIDVAVTPIINLPATNAAQTQGIYRLGGVNALFIYPSTSLFVGNAGNTTSNNVLAVFNVGVGTQALHGITTGTRNTAIGAGAMNDSTTATDNVSVGLNSMLTLTTGDANVAIGVNSLDGITTGNDNIAVGFGSATSYTGAESSNIIISSTGTIGDNNTTRIGTQGSGAGQQDRFYAAGIYGAAFGATSEVVFVDNTGKLGGLTGTDGEVIIASSATGPAWSTLTAGTGINITNASNSITIASTVAGGITTINGNGGVPVTDTTITVAGGNNINTFGTFNSLTINVSGTTNHSLLLGNSTGSIASLGVATNGQIPIGSTGTDPVLATITAGANITVTNAAGSITIAASGGGGGGITTLDGDAGSATGATVTIAGGNNITTSAAAATVTLNVSGTTNHGVQVGNAGGSLTSLGIGTTGQVLIGSTAANPAFGALGVNSGLTAHGVLLGENNSAIAATAAGTTGQVLIGATGADPAFGALGVNSALTAHSLLLGQNNSALTALGAATNGQIPIGSTGADPVLATLTAGANVTITNAAGSITIAASGGGGGGITTIDGDVGSATGATVTFTTASDCGSTVLFNASAAQVELLMTDGNSNILMGEGSGNNTGTGSQNTCLGRSCLLNYTTATGNTAVGYNAMFDVNATDYNTAVGDSALVTLATGGGENTAIGAQSLTQLATGSNNIGIGFQAGQNYTGGEINNIAIGNQGTTGENDTIRIGDGFTQTAFYTTGVFGTTVDIGSGTAVFVDNTGLLGTVTSSRRYKENIRDMESSSSNVLELRPVTFTYKNDATNERRFGLIAEEVDETLPDLVIYNKAGDPETVKYHDLPVLLLNELQKQHNIIADLSHRLHRLEERMRYESTR